MPTNVQELHQRIVAEINETRNNEMKEFVAQKKQRVDEGDKEAAKEFERQREAGIDVDKLKKSHEQQFESRKKELDEIKKKHAAKEEEPKIIAPEDFQARAFDAAIAPAEARALPPAYAAVFSSKDPQDKRSGGTGTDIFNYNIIDAWAWAAGDGWGWYGSGAGSYQVWAEWGYWYWVPTTKYYGITTHNNFRGFYIVRAFDDWWISAYSRAVVSIWVDVWQYNWKGWSNVNVLDVGGDNINVNQRFDTDRHHYHTALLAGGDWAYIRNVVGLDVYARAGGSYTELNFAVGAANYLAAPHVHIY
jgi:hypothetical protein